VSGLDELFAARMAVVVPEVVGAEVAAEVRARLARAGWSRYGLVDRGRYDRVEAVAEPALCDAVVAVAAELTDQPLRLREAWALRLGAGDYLLAHHDRVPDDRVVELTLDLSAAAVAGAEVHYRRRGQVFFRAPCAPGTLAVVERDPSVTCHHTYVSQRHAGAEVVRLVLRAAPPR
jgi:hypothetical protein